MKRRPVKSKVNSEINKKTRTAALTKRKEASTRDTDFPPDYVNDNELYFQAETKNKYPEPGEVLLELDKAAAERMIKEIESKKNKGLYGDDIRSLLFYLDARQGHIALGFKSLHQCIKKYFPEDIHNSTLYRLANAAKIEHIITGNGVIGAFPESVVRELGKVKNDEEKKLVWNKSMESLRGKRKHPSAEEIKKTISHMQDTGEISRICARSTNKTNNETTKQIIKDITPILRNAYQELIKGCNKDKLIDETTNKFSALLNKLLTIKEPIQQKKVANRVEKKAASRNLTAICSGLYK